MLYIGIYRLTDLNVKRMLTCNKNSLLLLITDNNNSLKTKQIKFCHPKLELLYHMLARTDTDSRFCRSEGELIFF